MVSGIYIYTLPKTNSSPLKINGWKMNCPFGMACFQAQAVSFREGPYFTNLKMAWITKKLKKKNALYKPMTNLGVIHWDCHVGQDGFTSLSWWNHLGCSNHRDYQGAHPQVYCRITTIMSCRKKEKTISTECGNPQMMWIPYTNTQIHKYIYIYIYIYIFIVFFMFTHSSIHIHVSNSSIYLISQYSSKVGPFIKIWRVYQYTTYTSWN